MIPALLFVANIQTRVPNGYEDYAGAATWIRGPEGTALLATREGEPRLDHARRLRAGLPKVLEMVAKGNEKAVWHPNPRLDLDTPLPQLADFARMGRALTESAYADFADGRSAIGTRKLIVVMDFAERLAPILPIFFAVGCRMQSEALRGVAAQRNRLSVADWRSLTSAVAKMPSRDTVLDQAFKSERAMLPQNLDIALRDVRRVLPADHPALGRIEAQVKAASPEQRAELKAECLRVAQDPSFRSSDSVAAEIVKAVLGDPAEAQEWIDELKIKYRLLLLHAEIETYRWEHGKLPSAVSNRGEIRFEPDGNVAQTYRLYHPGIGKSGPIDLLYRHAQGSSAALP